jgi:hypothetical protein
LRSEQINVSRWYIICFVIHISYKLITNTAFLEIWLGPRCNATPRGVRSGGSKKLIRRLNKPKLHVSNNGMNPFTFAREKEKERERERERERENSSCRNRRRTSPPLTNKSGCQTTKSLYAKLPLARNHSSVEKDCSGLPRPQIRKFWLGMCKRDTCLEAQRKVCQKNPM